MTQWIKTSVIVFGIGVGVGVITCVIRVFTRKKQEALVPKTTTNVRRVIKIPKTFVGLIMGRKGATINGIRERTKAKIIFEDSDNEFTVATIIGNLDEVEEAISSINKIMTKHPNLMTKELFVPEQFSDYLIGKNGDNIRQICYESGSKIIVDWTPSRETKSSVKIIVKGKENEVNLAVEIIDKLIAEADVHSNKFVHVAGRALPEKLPPLNLNSSANHDLPREKLVPNSSDGYVDVFVSAVESPSKFWVQISGSKSTQLDKLATEMSDFYNNEKNKLKFQLNSPNIGDIVAAYYAGDISWYRAQVLNVSNKDDDNVKIEIFYLDFGDGAKLPSNLICSLKPEYLSIPFQAIECSLANVKPNSGNTWSEKAVDKFSTLVYLALWKVIMAKPVEKLAENANDEIQRVELYDTNSDSDLNISEELVKLGLACFYRS